MSALQEDREKVDGVMKEKNEAVIANTAIRALCCFRALSFEGFFSSSFA